jgi:hypothetical protein
VAHGLAYKRRDHVADDVVHAHVAVLGTEDAPVAEVEGDALLVEELSERLAGAKVENVGAADAEVREEDEGCLEAAPVFGGVVDSRAQKALRAGGDGRPGRGPMVASRRPLANLRMPSPQCRCVGHVPLTLSGRWRSIAALGAETASRMTGPTTKESGEGNVGVPDVMMASPGRRADHHRGVNNVVPASRK